MTISDDQPDIDPLSPEAMSPPGTRLFLCPPSLRGCHETAPQPDPAHLPTQPPPRALETAFPKGPSMTDHSILRQRIADEVDKKLTDLELPTLLDRFRNDEIRESTGTELAPLILAAIRRATTQED